MQDGRGYGGTFKTSFLQRKLPLILTWRLKGIVNKYTAAGLPSRFVCSIIYNFDSGKDNLIIPQWLFEEKNAFTIRLPFSPSNESFVKTFMSKLKYFTNEKYKFNVVWNTRKVQSLFSLKDKVNHYSCVIYWGDCSCWRLPKLYWRNSS